MANGSTGSSDPNAPGRDANPNADPYFQGSQHDRFSGSGTDQRSVDEFTAHNSYGGAVGGADQAFNTYRNMGAQGANRGAYNADYTQNNQSREQQSAALGLDRQAAMGNAPSVAQLMGRNMLDQSLQAQQAAAASARGGPLAQAAAQSQAAGGMAAQQQQGVNSLAALRAQEMAQARGQYFNDSSGMRGQDLGQTAQQIQNEQFQRSLNQNDQQFYEQLGQNVNMAQLQANQNAQKELTNEFGVEQGSRQADEGLSWDKMKTVAGAGAHVFGSGVASVAQAVAKGGHVQGAQPYLVGEKGPELVVPNKDGFVMTALQTAALLGAPPTHQQLASLHGARADGGPVAAPAPSAPPAWLAANMAATPDYSNHVEAEKIRASFQPSIGDTAQAQYDQAHSKDGQPGFAASMASGIGDAGQAVAASPTAHYAYSPADYQIAPIQVLRAQPMTLARALGGSIAGQNLAGQNLADPGGESADELGMGGVGGYVSATIGHENRDIAAALHPMARAYGGPIAAADDQGAGDNGMVLKGGGLDVMGSLAATNAIDTNYLHHPGAQAGYARASGGPVEGIASVYNQKPATPAPRPVTLSDALSGIEHLKARIAELEGRRHG